MGHGLTNADVHRVLDGLVGRKVEITIEWFVELADPSSGLQAGETSRGEARWAPSPSGGEPAVLEVGGKGMPVSGLGFARGERVPGGVRWCHVLGRTTVILADGEETEPRWAEAQRPDRAGTSEDDRLKARDRIRGELSVSEDVTLCDTDAFGGAFTIDLRARTVAVLRRFERGWVVAPSDGFEPLWGAAQTVAPLRAGVRAAQNAACNATADWLAAPSLDDFANDTFYETPTTGELESAWGSDPDDEWEILPHGQLGDMMGDDEYDGLPVDCE